jgi:glycosyltransferase involved in cell wall biosynthesis
LAVNGAVARWPAVLHVNDCAFVAAALVEEACSQGYRWGVHLPTAKRASPARTAAGRAWDVVDFRRTAAPYDLLHVHYGLMAYYAWRAGKPFALHLHGSDVRDNLRRGGVQARLVRWGLKHAGVVYYSTPDLAEKVLELRSDAHWLPAPVEARFFRCTEARCYPSGATKRVLFASRWDPVKGSAQLLQVAEELARSGRPIEMVGFDWGQQRLKARAVGVRLVPLLRRAELPAFLSSFDVMVGQMGGDFLPVTELEAMAVGLPVVSPIRSTAYSTPPPIIGAPRDHVADAVISWLDSASAKHHHVAEAEASWVRVHHSPDVALARVLEDYRKLLR